MNTNPDFNSSHEEPEDFAELNVPVSGAAGPYTPDDSTDRVIDLNELLISNKAATFFMRVNSDAMTDAGIHIGDMVIVDCSIEPVNGRVVIAVLSNEWLIRRLEINGHKKRLVPATRKLSAIDVSDGDFSVWGVVTYVIHSL